MKKNIIIILICCLICCSCNSKEKDNKDFNYEGINISEINDKDIIYQTASIDMNVTNIELNELYELSDIVIKGKLIKLDLNVSEQTNAIYTDYTFMIDTTYKGDIKNKVVINMLGGIMKYDEYMNQLIKNKTASESDIDNEKIDKYVCFSPKGFNPLSPEGEYVIYASYNEDKKCYYPTNYFYGIYKSENGKDYERFKTENNDNDNVVTIGQIEKSVK